jgi:hypothetical protein
MSYDVNPYDGPSPLAALVGGFLGGGDHMTSPVALRNLCRGRITISFIPGGGVISKVAGRLAGGP